MRERQRVGDARRSRHPLGDQNGLVKRYLADPPLASPPLEEQPLSAVGDILAAGLDQELRRLDHARADRPVRNHEHARPREPLRATVLQPDVLFLGEHHLGLLGRMSDERLEPGMSLGDDRIQVVDLALEPVRRRHPGRDGRIYVPVHPRAHHDHVGIRVYDRAEFASVAVTAVTVGDKHHHQPPA